MNAVAMEETPVPRVPGFLVLFPSREDAWAHIENVTGAMRTASTHRDASSAAILPAKELGGPEIHVYEGLGVVAMDLTPDELAELEAAGATIVENTIMRHPPPLPGNEALALEPGATSMAGTSTWGVSLVEADAGRYTGRGIRVAIIDTGIDLDHPDFAGRIVAHQSFVPGALTVQDGDGHGTHVAGTVGGRNPPGIPRYGVAPECEFVIAKVLDDQGSGYTQWIIDGMNWAAIDQEAVILNLSLGGPRTHGSPFNKFYEEVADRLLDAGVLVVAAAGNSSNRPIFVAAMGNPAACPSVDAVVAIDQAMQIASFSCEGDTVAEPDCSAPGVDIYSSWTGGGYHTISGTSMAAPHVSGLAAHLAEATGFRGRALREALSALSARRPLGPTKVYGLGLTMSSP